MNSPFCRSSGPLLILAALSLLVSCKDVRPDNADQLVTAMNAYYGSTEAFTADLRLIAQPAEGDRLAFNISLWVDRDGRTRLSAQKFNVRFLEGMVHGDGSFVAVLVRDEAVVKGHLDDIAAELADNETAAAFARIEHIIRLLRHGPGAGLRRWTLDTSDETTVLRGALEADWEWRLALRGRTVNSGQLLNPAQEPLFALVFDHLQRFAEVQRPRLSELQIPDDEGLYLFRLYDLAPVPSIAASNMALTIPSDWPALSIRQFLDTLIATEQP